MRGSDQELIAPVELTFLPASLLLTVHPSAASAVSDQLGSLFGGSSEISIKQRFLNIFRVFSKQAAL